MEVIWLVLHRFDDRNGRELVSEGEEAGSERSQDFDVEIEIFDLQIVVSLLDEEVQLGDQQDRDDEGEDIAKVSHPPDSVQLEEREDDSDCHAHELGDRNDQGGFYPGLREENREHV